MNIGSHHSEETRALMSASHMGRPISDKAKISISAGMMGKKNALGIHPSKETREKMSIAHMGCEFSPEHRANLSVAQWKGGPKVVNSKKNAKRRALGFVPLNTFFIGCEGHHLDNEYVIYIPKELHRSIYHRQSDGIGMEQINVLAYEWLARVDIA